MLLSLLYLGKFPGWETSARPLANASENLARRMENRHWGVEFCIGYIRAYPVRASTKNFKFPSLSFPCPLQHLLRQTAGNTKHGAAKRPISQISHNVSDKHPTMHHFVTEMCTHMHISHKKRDWFTVWFVREVYRLRCLKINIPIKKENPLFDILLSELTWTSNPPLLTPVKERYLVENPLTHLTMTVGSYCCCRQLAFLLENCVNWSFS